MYEWPRNPIIGRHETIIGRPEIYGMKMMNTRTICVGGDYIIITNGVRTSVTIIFPHITGLLYSSVILLTFSDREVSYFFKIKNCNNFSSMNDVVMVITYLCCNYFFVFIYGLKSRKKRKNKKISSPPASLQRSKYNVKTVLMCPSGMCPNGICGHIPRNPGL
jgi:hypothetical protein